LDFLFLKKTDLFFFVKHLEQEKKRQEKEERRKAKAAKTLEMKEQKTLEVKMALYKQLQEELGEV
jgi:large-conductance mechanosensitive channel